MKMLLIEDSEETIEVISFYCNSKGNIDFSKCSFHLLSGEYLQAQEILKYINHPGNFYLVLKNNSAFFDKTISGNLLLKYLGSREK